MEIKVQTVTVRTKRAFTISHSSSDAFERVILSVDEAGVTGRGEAAPTTYYRQSAESAAEALRGIRIEDPWDIEGTLRLNGDLPPASKAALDAALHDLAARRLVTPPGNPLSIPLYKMLGLARPTPVSAYTLGIADRETTLADAERLSAFPILKMKVGGETDIETVRAVAELSDAAIWVDANEAFSPEEAPAVVRELVGMGVSMIEQPVPAAEGPQALRAATEAASPVPVIADESALTAKDVPALAGCVGGVNVKLAKCGGIRGALEMVHTARAHGMSVMLGCMVETSLGIAAAAQISGLFDLIDLDGAMLLADDPFRGLAYENGRIHVPETPGLGVAPR